VRVILHIGTHKTGTSALQECLRRNETILARKGIHYARVAPYKNSNSLARTVAKNRGPEVKRFISRHVDQAVARGADTIVISAESFYAMAMFFHKFNGRQSNYWDLEHDSIEFLARAFPQDLPVKPVAFFRRQDRFLESIYGAVVKSRGVATGIDEFGLFFREALDYWRHMEIWSAMFPDCSAYSYEQASNSICDFFFREVLQLSNTDEFDGFDVRANLRLSRDVLEYKRMLNAMEMSDVDRYLSDLACTELSRALPDDGTYQDYLVPQSRLALLQEVAIGNVLLSKTFGMNPFPEISNESLNDQASYPGLSSERAKTLDEGYALIRRGARYRIGRSALLIRQFIQQRLPKLSWIIRFGRPLGPNGGRLRGSSRERCLHQQARLHQGR
jgi:hypothetical protein